MRQGNTTRQRNSTKSCSWSLEFKHMIATENPWIDCSCEYSGVHEDPKVALLKSIAADFCAEAFVGKEDNHEDSKGRHLSFVNSLKACAKEKDLIQGNELHADIRNDCLLAKNTYVGNTLISMYAKCGAVNKAQQLLEEMPVRHVASWNALITGHVQQGLGQEALSCYEQMQHEGICPNAITYTCILKACGILEDVETGEKIHQEIVNQGLLGRDTVLGNALVSMYAKCGVVCKAAHVLDEMPVQVVGSWNSLIAGYVQHRLGEEALKCYERMQNKGVSPNTITYTCIFKACGITQNVERGMNIHDKIVTEGLFGVDVVLDNALVDMYAKCGAIAKAQQVLDDMPVRNVASWNSLIAGYVNQGQGKDALSCYDRIRSEGLFPNAITYTCSLSACGITGNIARGRQIHNEIAVKSLLIADAALGNALVDMYAKCGEITKALHVFEELPVRDAVSWSELIAGYARQGLGKEAFDCFEHMRFEGVTPDVSAYTAILKACGSVQDVHKGKQIHDEINTHGLLKVDVMLGNALVGMYAKCCAVGKAQMIDELPTRNVITWNGFIAGCVQHDLGEEALNCYERMLNEGISPNAVTYLCILKACGIIQDISRGKKLHDEIVSQKLLETTNGWLGNALVDMYAKCGALAKAHDVLRNLPVRDVVSWNALITGYAQQGLVNQAVDCYEWMQADGISPDRITCAVILKSCGITCNVEKGAIIFDNMITNGLAEVDVVVGNALVGLYAKCGALAKAQRLLDEMSIRDAVSWNALISGYVQQDQGKEALDRFQQMQMEGVTPNAITYTYILKACGIIQDANRGRQIHGEIASQGLLGIDSVLGNALVDMYGKSGASTEAYQVLDELHVRNVCSWSALTAGYVLQGQGKEALECYDRMLNEGISSNTITYTCVLKACALTQDAEMGKEIHEEIVKQKLLEGNVVLGNALIDMYTQCGAVAKAAEVLNELPTRDAISWSTVMAGYTFHGEGKECMDIFERMQSEGLLPDAITYTHILKACSIIGDFFRGQRIHDEIISKGLLLDDALAKMYAEFGDIASGHKVLEMVPVHNAVSSTAFITRNAQSQQCEDRIDCFQRMQMKGATSNMISWNALLGGCVQQGLAEEALNCFHSIQMNRISLDAAMFTLALKACGHLGLVNNGQMYFQAMRENYGITPNKYHYTCMVKVFGHAGHLDMALALIKQMPFSGDPPLWSTILGASQKWGNVKLGRMAFENIVKLDEGDDISCGSRAGTYGSCSTGESIST